jgi:hydrogenase maturation protease
VSPTIVLGMGNPILSDDGLGLEVARRLRGLPMPDGVEIAESEVGGLRLLELLRGYRKAILIDALKTGRPVGEILRVNGNDFRGGHRWGAAHSIHLGTALELGEELGYSMPSECVVYAVEADDVETFGEELCPAVAESAGKVVDLVYEEVWNSAGSPAPAFQKAAWRLPASP